MQQMKLACLLVTVVGGAAWSDTNPATAAANPPEQGEPAAEHASAAQPVPRSPHGYLEESSLPEGFPPPGPVGQIVEKSYPLCRTYSAAGNDAFLRCFAYLSQQKHEMTAPVIIAYHQQAAESASRAEAVSGLGNIDRMHFILQKPSLDQPKQAGPVTVADLETMRVLSIAVQGRLSAAQLDEARKKIEAEIQRRPEIVAAGPLRVLGYNSPMVAEDRRFWEVQLPIKNQDASAGE